MTDIEVTHTCDGCPSWAPGIRPNMTGSFDADCVERCDSCAMYPGDMEAAEALARLMGNGYIVSQHDSKGRLCCGSEAIYIRAGSENAMELVSEMMRADPGEAVEWRVRFVHRPFHEGER